MYVYVYGLTKNYKPQIAIAISVDWKITHDFNFFIVHFSAYKKQHSTNAIILSENNVF